MEEKKTSISIITPSIRLDFLEMVRRCLRRQTFEDWEWNVCAPFKYEYANNSIIDRPRASGELYSLNKSFNDLFSASKGELIISIVDGIWFPPDTLERFWNHYQLNKKALITVVGDQYKVERNNTYEELVWKDPRKQEGKTFFEVLPMEMELCVASLPKQAVLDCGGMDEIYDTGAAVGEKEMCFRLRELGYKFFMDQSIEYRALHHERLSKEWDKYYKISTDIFVKHMEQLKKGQRLLKMDCVK